MNKFKSLLLLCMCFAFAAFPLSNQGFCNGSPLVILDDLANCTGDIIVSHDCNLNETTATVTIFISNSTGTTATVSAVSNPGGTLYTGTSTITLSGGAGSTTIEDNGGNEPSIGENLTISVTINGADCDETTIAFPDNDYAVSECCVTCYTSTALLPTEAACATSSSDELCGDDEDFHITGGDATVNATVGCNGNRVVTVNCDGDINLGTLGNEFIVFAGTEFTTTNMPNCPTFAPDNDETSFTTTPVNNTQVKIAPNPVTNIAQIQYTLPEEGRVQVSVFDMKGNRVAIVANGHQFSGVHTVDFDASNLARGFYYLTIQTANTQVTERMVIVK